MASGKRIVTFLGGLVVLCGLMINTGCQRAEPDFEWRSGPEPQPAPGGSTGEQAEETEKHTLTPPEQAKWSSLTKPATQDQESEKLEPVDKKRWKDVAVYYAYDRSTIATNQRPKLEKLAEYLKQNPSYQVVVEGHCDKRGSAEYNRALGQRRAIAVKRYLEDLGIDASRIETVSYGEEKPAVTNASTAEEFQQNRRAEFVIGVKE